MYTCTPHNNAAHNNIFNVALVFLLLQFGLWHSPDQGRSVTELMKCIFVSLSVTEEDLDSLNSKLKMDFSTYVSQTVTAFTRCDMADVNFVYQLKQLADGAVDFLWKKEVDDIKVTVHIPPESDSSVRSQHL